MASNSHGAPQAFQIGRMQSREGHRTAPFRFDEEPPTLYPGRCDFDGFIAGDARDGAPNLLRRLVAAVGDVLDSGVLAALKRENGVSLKWKQM